MKTAWICGALGLVCCGPLTIVGLISANKAKQKGHPSAQAAIILNIVGIVVWAIGIGLRGALFR